MNIYNYIDNFGMYSFSEKEFNEIDSVIFSFLSYANFEGIFDDKKKLTIKEVGRMHLGLHKNDELNVVATREAIKLLRYIKDTNRYKNCLLYNYEYIGNDNVQFGVISIEYLKNNVYVSFEGTNQLFSGWKENFMLSFEFPTISHKMAISYLNKHYTFTNKKLLIGGHSKGGNLALVGGMYCNIFVRNKIKMIYNFDGPGLLDKEFYSKRFKEILNKYIHIIPDESEVGLFLNNDNDYVIASTSKGPIDHNIVYWQVEEDHFIKTNLSPLSRELKKEIKTWLSKYNKEDKLSFTKNLESIYTKANIKSIIELKEKKSNILKLIYESKDMNDKTKSILIDFIMIIIKCLENTKKEEFKNIINENMYKLIKK
jgi:hypothetical protein